jgi:uncharacterized protein YbcC (UPF0753/DUF2309 family)
MAISLLTLEQKPARDCAVEAACRRVPPLWPLQNFVAVNPFLGLSEMSFTGAARLLGKVAHRDILMDAEYYLNRIGSEAIRARDIKAAIARDRSVIDTPDPVSWLVEQLKAVDPLEQILTVADWLDQTRTTGWASFIVDEISKWCSSYFDRGQSSWKAPWNDLPLFTAWKRAAEIDANPEAFGLPGFRQYVRDLPDSEGAAIEHTLDTLNIPPELACDFLHRELMSVFGWSAYAAYRDRQGSGQQFVRQLLAIRLAYDAALSGLDRGWRCQFVEAKNTGGPLYARYIAQLAAEHAFRETLVRKVISVPHRAGSASRSTFQAIFCIDVRSEVYRRALESQSPGIETIGFAGFFGMPLEVDSSARCPVLIAPQYQLQAARRVSAPDRLISDVKTAWKGLRSSAAACFSSVEVGGAWSGVGLITQSFPKSAVDKATQKLSWSIPLSARVDLAAGALKNMSIDASRLAPVVLICGHGSRTENNPYGSSLDCGACGGHQGDVNARFAAALMNDSAVRHGLQERGIVIPGDTVFVAGLHNTTTDDVTLYDEHLLNGKRRTEIKGWLESASRRARRERSRALMPDAAPVSNENLDVEIRQRSADWSEVRPEWGLAGNAAFIAARRWRTRGLDLKGRVFLHDYDAASDPDASILQLILTAPVVVASWINLQYYGSTVNNRLFGSGNKVLHNVVGTFGVWEGNGGDLRTGLPIQSLHDGTKWIHEPLRLQVFIESSCDRIDRVLDANPGILSLVENDWIHLLSIEGSAVYERVGRADWHLNGAACH